MNLIDEYEWFCKNSFRIKSGVCPKDGICCVWFLTENDKEGLDKIANILRLLGFGQLIFTKCIAAVTVADNREFLVSVAGAIDQQYADVVVQKEKWTFLDFGDFVDGVMPMTGTVSGKIVVSRWRERFNKDVDLKMFDLSD